GVRTRNVGPVHTAVGGRENLLASRRVCRHPVLRVKRNLGHVAGGALGGEIKSDGPGCSVVLANFDLTRACSVNDIGRRTAIGVHATVGKGGKIEFPGASRVLKIGWVVSFVGVR